MPSVFPLDIQKPWLSRPSRARVERCERSGHAFHDGLGQSHLGDGEAQCALHHRGGYGLQAQSPEALARTRAFPRASFWRELLAGLGLNSLGEFVDLVTL